MKKALKIGGLTLLGLFLIFGLSIGVKMWADIREAKDLAARDISAPDLAQVPDGTWTGQTEWGMLAVEAQVTVLDGTITSIELLRHDNGLGGKAEVITERILEAQGLDVDAISGATISSRAILHAVADALNNGQ